LKRVGFKIGAIDGVSGPATRAAIRAYQRSLGMKPTGTMDDALVELLKSDPDAQMLTGAR
jgi:localization factor PodJL